FSLYYKKDGTSNLNFELELDSLSVSTLAVMNQLIIYLDFCNNCQQSMYKRKLDSSKFTHKPSIVGSKRKYIYALPTNMKLAFLIFEWGLDLSKFLYRVVLAVVKTIFYT
ncbi:hypothetical protein ACJX0J_039355, partial [Zea mays]